MGESRSNIGLPESLHDDRWHLYGLVITSGGAQLSLDGQPLPGIGYAGGLQASPVSVRFQASHGAMSLGQVAMFDKQLTLPQLLKHWAVGRGVGCASPPTAPGYPKTVTDSGPLSYWPLNGVVAGGAASDISGNCRDAAVVNVASPAADGVYGSAVRRASSGPVVFASDSGLGGEATYEWWVKIPPGSGASTRLLAAGNSAITVDLSSDRNTIIVSGNACSYHGNANAYTRPGGFGDGQWHHIAISMNIGAEVSQIAVDGTPVVVRSGEFGAFIWRFCSNGAGNGMVFQVPDGGAIDEIAILNKFLGGAELAAHGSRPPLETGFRKGEVLGAVFGSVFANTHTLVRADPVNTATGSFVHRVDDVSTPGRGVEFSLSRSYDSQVSAVPGPFGPGWGWNLGERIVVDAAPPSSGATA